MRAASTQIEVLGPVRADGVDPGGPLARSLLVALSLGPAGETHSFASLTEDLWADDPPQHPRAALQSLVSRVRGTCGDDVVLSRPGGYALDRDCIIDLTRAERALLASRAARDTALEALGGIDTALGLWQGEPGADLGGAPIGESLIARTGALRAELQLQRARALRLLGRASEACETLERLRAEAPLDETVCEELMRSLAVDRREGEALAVFVELRALLRDRLGTSPGAAITELNAEMLRSRESAAVPASRIGVPAPPNRLIGRERDLTEVRGLLRQVRLVTVLGVGGLGKTRLAVELAGEGVCPVVVFVRLASVRNDDDVPLAIAAALGIIETGSTARLTENRPRPELRERIVAQLGERQTLVILDNCEQVVDGVAEWAADMLAAVPTLRILATSRTPLAIGAEHGYALAALSTRTDADAPGLARPGDSGPAVELFRQRALAARPNAVLDERVVARLCDRLDGLPLAIELAAARVRTMSPEQIEARLQDRFALLRIGERAAPERHRTLEAVIEWSWELLDAPARRALAMLSVLPAGFSAQTASAMLGSEEADEVLDHLASQSLLLVTDDTATRGIRFRMLETVREFGLAKLQAEDGEPNALAAMDRWACDFALAHLDSLLDEPLLAEVSAEHDNLITVLRRAIDDGRDADALLVFAALCQIWIVRSAFEEIVGFSDAAFAAALRIPEDELPLDALMIVLTIGAFFSVLGGMTSLRQVVRLRRLRRKHRDVLPHYGAIADLLLEAPDVDRMQRRAEQLRRSPDPAIAVIGEQTIVQLAENSGDPETAVVAAERCWKLARSIGSSWLASLAATNLAQLSSQQARSAEALKWLARAGDGLRELGADDELQRQRWMYGGNYIRLGMFAEARELFQSLIDSETPVEEAGVEFDSIGWFGLAELARAEGDLPRAAEYYETAMQGFASADQRASPWFVMAVAGLISAGSFDELLPADRVVYWVTRLRSRMLGLRRLQPGYTDLPVLGTCLLGWSAWALGVTGMHGAGLRALVLAEAFHARQDLLSLDLAAHVERAERAMGADRLAEARTELVGLDKAERIELAYRTLMEHPAN